ncbi:MAG: CDP-alcohol phosphatidyltransferase family protein [Candidatus Limivicinus sp.]|jgi:cardiolipin synthase
MSNKFKSKVFTIPNILTFIRLLLIPVFVWLYIGRQDYKLTSIILLLSGFTDVLDGFIARHFDMVSDLGKAIDPVADKLTQLAMLLCLVSRFRLMLVPLSLLVVKELFCGITCVMAIKKTGVVEGADWHGKLTTFLLYAMMILHLIWADITPTVSTVSILLCTASMILSFIMYGIRNINAIKGRKQD